jgi:hypothetical protein
MKLTYPLAFVSLFAVVGCSQSTTTDESKGSVTSHQDVTGSGTTDPPSTTDIPCDEAHNFCRGNNTPFPVEPPRGANDPLPEETQTGIPAGGNMPPPGKAANGGYERCDESNNFCQDPPPYPWACDPNTETC